MDTLSPLADNGNIPQRRCTGPCGQLFPETDEFFQRSKMHKGGLRSQCKKCQKFARKTYNEEHPEVQKMYYAAHREEKLRYSAEYHATHKEKRAQYNAQYNIEHREEIKEQRAKYYYEHQEYYREHNAKYYAAHSEEARQYSAQYRAEHPEHVQMYRDAHRGEHRQYDRAYHQEHQEKKKLSSAAYRREHYEELREKQKQYWHSPRGIIAKRAHAHNYRARKRNAQGSHTTEELYQQFHRQQGKCYYCHAKLSHSRNSWHGDHIVPLSREGTNDISNIVIACPKCNGSKYNKLPHEWEEGGRLL